MKKEIKGYFLSPIGYVFIGLFLAMCSIFFYLDVAYYGSLQFENMFYSVATVLTFIIPILTMRMFAEERKVGTEQLLYTSPKSILSIILGKFVAAIIVIFIITWFLPNISEIFAPLSLINMFNKFPSGLIAIEEIVTYISYTIFFVLLTLIILQRRKSVK